MITVCLDERDEEAIVPLHYMILLFRCGRLRSVNGAVGFCRALIVLIGQGGNAAHQITNRSAAQQLEEGGHLSDHIDDIACEATGTDTSAIAAIAAGRDNRDFIDFA